MAGFISIKS